MKTLLLFITISFLLGCNLYVEQTKEWPAKPKELSAKEKGLKLLEDRLGRVTDSNQIYIDKIFELDPFNDAAIGQILRLCREADNYDNCWLFFDNLTKKYPDSIRAYLVKAKYSGVRTTVKDPEKVSELWLISRIKILQQAIELDSNYYDTNYELALVYYKLFLKKPTTEYAINARKWFMKAGDIDNEERTILKYPIIQLSTYLNDSRTANDYGKFTYQIKANAKGVPDGNKHNWYFPSEPFLERKQNWESDSTLDLVGEFKDAAFVLDWYSDDLNFYQEPMISNGYRCDVYRFLYLRSFNVPLVIRMERNDGRVTIRWKKCHYNQLLDQYEWGVDSTKKLPDIQWDKFEKMLSKVNFWQLPTDTDDGSTDGAEWILEAFVNGKYKIAATNMEHSEFGKCLRYLMDLTDLNLPEKEIY
jgi:hypothetical protein